MRKAHVASWAAVTVAVGASLFAGAIAIVNQQKSAGHSYSALAYLAAPLYVQLALWFLGATYGRRRRYPEISAGILTGIAIEALGHRDSRGVCVVSALLSVLASKITAGTAARESGRWSNQQDSRSELRMGQPAKLDRIRVSPESGFRHIVVRGASHMTRMFRLFFGFSRWVAAVCVALLLISGGAAAQDLQSKLDQYMQASVKVNHFMGSVLVAQHGKILFAKGYGMANIKERIPNASDTAFRIGSVTKEFTATAILKLQSEGKLNVQDPICKYVPNCPADWHPIKIFHLLTHTSGIPNFTDFPNYLKIDTKPITPAQLLADFKDKPLDFKPGAKFRYSNSGYEVLGYIIERVSGETYQRFLQQNIFGPLGMKESGYDRSHPTAKNHAVGYVYAHDSYQPSDYVDMTVPYSAGALYSTVQDLYTWDRALEAGKVLPKPLLAEMFAPQVSTGSSGNAHYGFGWFISTTFGHKEYAHEGGIQGFTCVNSWFPEQDAYVIVLDNMESEVISTVARNLAAILFEQKYELPKVRQTINLSPEELQNFAGQYQINPHLVLTITLADGQLNLQRSGQSSLPIFPESKTDFFLKVADAQISFVVNPEGKATGLILHQGGQDLLGKKVN